MLEDCVVKKKVKEDVWLIKRYVGILASGVIKNSNNCNINLTIHVNKRHATHISTLFSELFFSYSIPGP